MGKFILTYNDVYDINQKFEKKELKFKIHLHDTCGSQSFTIEPLAKGDSNNEKSYIEMKKVIMEYFNEKQIKVEFLENNLEFFIVQ